MAIGRRRILATLGVVTAMLLVVMVVRAALLSGEAPVPGPAPAIPPVDPSVATEHLGRIIRVPTVSLAPDEEDGGDPATFDTLHRELESLYPALHATLQREVIGQHSLLYRWAGSDPDLPPLLLAAHLDVVPVEPGTEDAWAHPPFSGVVADGFVWGRGAIDDKLGVATILEAVEGLVADGFVPRRSVLLAFGHDEEVGGRSGAAAIAARLEQEGVRPWLVLDEGGAVIEDMLPGVPAPVALIGVAEKGYASIELRSHDAGGHSNMPPEHGAIGRLAAAITRLEDHPMPAALRGPTALMIDRLAPHVSFGLRLALANRWLLDPLIVRALTSEPPSNASVRTTTAATIFQAGVADNVLPSVARAVVNFRLLPGDTVDDVVAHVREAIDDEEIEIDCWQHCWDPSPVSPVDGEPWTVVEQAVQHAYPDALVTPYLVIGATDSRWYQPLTSAVYRFLPVRMTPADRSRMHGTDERVAVDDVADAVRFYATVVVTAAGP